MGKTDDGKVTALVLLPILLCYLFILPVLAYDGTVTPSSDAGGDEALVMHDPDEADATCETTMCSSEDCSQYLRDDPSSPDGDYITHDETSNQELILNMGDPTCTYGISTDPDDQQVVGNWSECEPGTCDKASTTAEPVTGVYWYCDVSGTPTLQGTLFNSNIGPSEVDQEFQSTWTFSTGGGDCEADGSDVQFSIWMPIDGSKTKGISCYESVEWNYTCADAPSDRRVIITDTDAMNPMPQTGK
jgi:hypothetical protein